MLLYEDDSYSPYVKEADEAYKLEGNYLDPKEIISIAKIQVLMQFIGIWLLSKNAGFANSVKKAGIIWIDQAGMSLKKWGWKLLERKLKRLVFHFYDF